MRRLRRFFEQEIFFVTIRTVEQRYALDPYASPNAWHKIDDGPLDLETRLAMNDRGRACVKTTAELTEVIAKREQDPELPGPEVPYATFTDSIPNIIGSIMARATQMYGVRLFGYVWMGNHAHLLVQAPNRNFPDFMCYMNGQIAANINRYLGRQNQLWARRYAAGQILDEAEELDKLAYVLANPQNAGIASAIDDWPGLSSATFFFTNQEQRFLCFDRTTWHNKGRPANIAPFLSTVVLKHDLLPQLQGLSKKAIRRLIRKHLKTKVNSSTASQVNAPSSLSVRTQLVLRTVIPTDRPESAKRNRRKRSPQPLCHTTIPVLYKIYEEWDGEFRVAYKNASKAYRSGETNVEFPPGSFAPSKYPLAKYPSNLDENTALHPTRRNLTRTVLLAALIL
jgi:REP element-mobilizing transposase RayT